MAKWYQLSKECTKAAQRYREFRTDEYEEKIDQALEKAQELCIVLKELGMEDKHMEKEMADLLDLTAAVGEEVLEVLYPRLEVAQEEPFPTEPEPELSPVAKAEENARLKAETETKARAQEEARLKAETEAKAKAE